MHEHKSMGIHYLIRAGILAGFAFYVVKLVKIDKLQYYIVPKMIPYVKVTSIVLFLLAVYYIYLALQSTHQGDESTECDCGHAPSASISKNIMMYGVFIVPLLMGFMLPDKIMGSEVAAVKGMNLNVSSIQTPIMPTAPPLADDREDGVQDDSFVAIIKENSLIPEDRLATIEDQLRENDTGSSDQMEEALSSEDKLDALFPTDEYTEEYGDLGKQLYPKDRITVTEEGFLEIITVIDLYRQHFIGKKLEISGFVYREDKMASNQFVISRMAMTCCAADSMPYGILVESSRAASYAEDSWMKLTGIIGVTEYDGVEIISLEAQKIEMMEAPKDPYVYPYFGDFADLVQE
ncbi:TIGR03943 family protein [Paenibacillus sp. 1011MAR3C5]|uniref:TIGR03943 family putative permease subunit n=1 Tax=Paenibacillus sp. 1011MAR3C5 TaxID=1675787 RepID=UPI000E6BA945|nr:TIGR03943 family protein [Paenibacillus sp. 1011MAR3C5]RJE87028.1 TIGR03943 family protein [Paenibacillus sp. 1011MAR3C5]